jgi:phosphonate transport system substrate-binding protein
MQFQRQSLISLFSSLAGLVAIASCTPQTGTPTAQTEPKQPENQTQQDNSPVPSSIKIVFPSRAGSTNLQQKADAVVAFLTKETNLPLQAVVADDAAAVEALRANQADVAFLSSRPALKAEKLANSRLYLAEVRPNYSGGYTYRSVFVVRQDSPLKSSDDPTAVLGQLRGKTIAFTSPTSGSGFIFPVGELVRQGLVPDRDRLKQFFGQVTYGGDYSKALQAVLRGQAEVAAVSEYALKPPYVTKAETQQLRILYAISGVPAHGVAIDDDVPASTRSALLAAMLKLNQPEHNSLLQGLYSSTQLVQVEHDRHLLPMREALNKAGMEL